MSKKLENHQSAVPAKRSFGKHPSPRRLQTWLDTGGPRRVDHHVGNCEDCQQKLDDLSALDDTTVSDLVAVTAPPGDLTDRVAEGVDTRLRDEAAATVFADLFFIGWDFVRCIVDPDPEITFSGDETEQHDDSGSTPLRDPHEWPTTADDEHGESR